MSIVLPFLIGFAAGILTLVAALFVLGAWKEKLHAPITLRCLVF